MYDTIEDVAGDGRPLEGNLEGLPRIRVPPFLRLPVLTLGHLGSHIVWSVLNARATLFLQRMGLYKSITAIVLIAGPLSGLLVQPAVGILSDQCSSKWGRRRPYIFGGLLGCISSLSCLLIASLFVKPGDQHAPILAMLLGIVGVVGIDVFINAMSAAHRALTMDMLGPDEQDMANAWATRFGSTGSVVGYLLSELDLSDTLPFVGSHLDQVTVLCFFAIVIVASTHSTLLFFIEESVLINTHYHTKTSLLSSVKKMVLQLYQCGHTLPQPIWDLFVIQFFSWISWFPVLFYCTSWVAEIYSRAHNAPAQAATRTDELGEQARRAGSQAMFFYACTGLVASIVLPWCIHDHASATKSVAQSYVRGKHMDVETQTDSHLQPKDADVQEEVPSALAPPPSVIPTSHRRWRGPTLAEVWFLSQVLFVVTMLFFTCPVSYYKSLVGAFCLVGALGISWAITLWIPYALLGILLFSAQPSTEEPDAVPLASLMEQSGGSISAPGTGVQETPINLRAEAGAVMGLHNWSIVLPQLVVSMFSSMIFMLPSLLWDQATADAVDSTGLLFRVGSLCTLYAAIRTFRWVRAYDSPTGAALV